MQLQKVVPDILGAASRASIVGDVEAADSVIRGSEAVLRAGGTSDDVVRVANSIVEGAERQSVVSNLDSDVMAQRANEIAKVVCPVRKIT
jgi:hypothetical protein